MAAAKKTKTAKAAALEAQAGERLVLDVVADRFRLGADPTGADLDLPRVMESLEVAFKRGGGHVTVYALPEAPDDSAEPELWRFSSGLHCPDSNRRYSTPTPGTFSFNSAAGACATCRGFGRVIGVDWGLVIPDKHKTLRSGAIKVIRHALVAAQPRAPAMGDQRRPSLGRPLDQAVVRHEALL
jgi:excinuclease ABC subunit A